jgi:hypothetical protein
MEMKERYIYAVVSKLPAKQRDDISNEIRMLIDDMIDRMDSYDEESKLEKVLIELGDPNKLADKYRDNTRYLIGPKYFNTYLYVLKIVFITVIISSSISAIIGMLQDNFLKLITGYISFTTSAVVYAFAIVTIIFAIFEYTNVDLSSKKWGLKDLPPVPNKKATISRGETIFGIIFATAFLVLVCSEFFGIFLPRRDEGFVLVPFFNYDSLSNFKIIIVILSLLGILKEVFKLIYGKWNMQLAILNSMLTVAITTIFVLTFSNKSIWNLSFTKDIANVLDISHTKIKFGFEKGIDVIIKIAIVAAIIEIVITLYKGYKYHEHKAH